MTRWPVEIDGREYSPIPESWIEHDDDLEAGSPRLYAVSALVEDHPNRLHVRYAHPVEETALRTTTAGVEHGDGIVPSGLAQPGYRWPRSLVPSSHVGRSSVLSRP